MSRLVFSVELPALFVDAGDAFTFDVLESACAMHRGRVVDILARHATAIDAAKEREILDAIDDAHDLARVDALGARTAPGRWS